jgi:hypothetical protein
MIPMSGLPRRGSNGFGMWFVTGLSRSPRPAAGRNMLRGILGIV